MNTTYPPAPNRLAPFFIELDKAAHIAKPSRPVINWAQSLRRSRRSSARSTARLSMPSRSTKRPCAARRMMQRGIICGCGEFNWKIQ